jgi:pimeloyl-ACP methyl ester carboxylesterase
MPTARTPDGVDIVYYDLGGSGPPVLLVHATGFHGMIWQPVARHLGRHFHCWAMDLRGHGDSGAPASGDFDWHGFGLDVLSVVDALDLVRPLAVGHSLGGAALLSAEQAVPGTLGALYLYEPAVVTPDRRNSVEGPDMALISRRRRARFASRDEARANFAAKEPMASFAPESLAVYVEYGFADADDGSVVLKCRPEHESAVFSGFADTDIFERYGEVGCPVTLVHGGAMEHQKANMALQASRLPRARVAVVEGLGHLGPMEDPRRVAEAIAADLAPFD